MPTSAGSASFIAVAQGGMISPLANFRLQRSSAQASTKCCHRTFVTRLADVSFFKDMRALFGFPRQPIAAHNNLKSPSWGFPHCFNKAAIALEPTWPTTAVSRVSNFLSVRMIWASSLFAPFPQHLLIQAPHVRL